MKEKIKDVVEIIKKGGIVIFPTDTVYGLGAMAEKKSVERIYRVKNRDFSKKIIALISNLDILEKIADISERDKCEIYPILKRFWPGELTVIFKGKGEFLNKFDTTMDTIGVRIPKDEIALDIIEKCGGILLTTSANISGELPAINVREINGKILENVDAVVEGKGFLSGKPSTIIKYENEKISLIREGNVFFGDILRGMKGRKNG